MPVLLLIANGANTEKAAVVTESVSVVAVSVTVMVTVIGEAAVSAALGVPCKRQFAPDSTTERPLPTGRPVCPQVKGPMPLLIG